MNGDNANCNGDVPYGTSTKGEYLARTPEVGGCVPNAWGLRDMRGNAKEWCADKHVGYKASSGLRGGSRSGAAENCRLADRNDSDPAASDGAYGFRLVLDRVLPEESSPAASKKPGQNFSTASGNWSKNYKAGTSKSRNIGELEYKFRDYPAGTFMMESLRDDEDYDDEDCDDEDCDDEESLTKWLELLKTEATQARREAATGKKPSGFSSNGGRADKVRGMDAPSFPADSASRKDSRKFVKKQNSSGCAPAGGARIPSSDRSGMEARSPGRNDDAVCQGNEAERRRNELRRQISLRNVDKGKRS